MANFSDASRDLEKAARLLTRAANNANLIATKKIVKTLQYYSGGQFSSEILAWLGHPYKIGGTEPLPYGDAAVINSQSGIFKRSWVYVRIPIAGTLGGVGYRIYNIASYASFLETGTSKMIARPILRFAEDYLDCNYLTILQGEIDKLDIPCFARK